MTVIYAGSREQYICHRRDSSILIFSALESLIMNNILLEALLSAEIGADRSSSQSDLNATKDYAAGR